MLGDVNFPREATLLWNMNVQTEIETNEVGSRISKNGKKYNMLHQQQCIVSLYDVRNISNVKNKSKLWGNF